MCHYKKATRVDVRVNGIVLNFVCVGTYNLFMLKFIAVHAHTQMFSEYGLKIKPLFSSRFIWIKIRKRGSWITSLRLA